MHHTWLRSLGFAALTAAVVATTASADPVRIRIGWAVAPAQLAPIMFDPPGVAQHNGKSYVLEPVRSAGSSIGLTALAAGELEISAMTFTQLGPAIQNAGLDDLRIIGDEFRDGVEGYDTNLYLVLKDGPIQKVEDLKGKVVAVNGIGSGQDVFLRVMMRKHGLEYQRDYTAIESTLPAMKALLAEKKADLVIGVKPFTEDPAFQGVSRVLFTQKEAVGQSDMIFLTARAGFIQKNRDALVDFFEDFIRVTRWYTDPANHDQAVAIASRFTKAPPQQLGWIFTRNDFYRDQGMRPDIDSLQKSVDMLKDFGFLKTGIEVKKYTDLSVIEDAAKRIK